MANDNTYFLPRIKYFFERYNSDPNKGFLTPSSPSGCGREEMFMYHRRYRHRLYIDNRVCLLARFILPGCRQFIMQRKCQLDFMKA